jgi:ABC-type amino acid transport substrate-binding protein
MAAARSTLDEIRERGVLRIAVEFNDPPKSGFPPEMYIDPDSGEPWGIAPIMGGLVAKDLGVELECVDLPWPTHIDALLEGEVDLLPKHTNAPSRGLLVEFTDGRLIQNRVTCTVRKDSSISSRAQIDDPKVLIAYWHGSIIGEVARERFPNARYEEFAKPALAVSEGQADVCLNDSITHAFLDVYPDLALLREEGELVVLSREYVHMSIAPGDPRFLNWLNNWYRYHEAQGTIAHWCEDWWNAHMADLA